MAGQNPKIPPILLFAYPTLDPGDAPGLGGYGESDEWASAKHNIDLKVISFF